MPGEEVEREIRAAKKEEKGPPAASLRELYQFTSRIEKLLLLIGALSALGAGVAMPMMLIAFGDSFDQLGVSETLPGQPVLDSKMTEMLLTFVWIGLGLGTGKFIYISCVEYVCSSLVLKYKRAFLKAVLRQDVAWYDTSSPEELTTKFEESMVKVQKGLSGSTFLLFEGLGYGLGAFIMGFVYDPRVAGITLAAVPLLIIPASAMMYIVENGTKIVNKAYGKAGGIATEALFSMRTIVSLGIEGRFEKRYSSSLDGARRATVRNMAAFGVSVGCALSAYLIMMAVAIIYGTFELAKEIDNSAFEFVVPIGGDQYNHFCADQSGTIATFNVTTSSVSSPCDVPLRLSCQTAGAYVQVGVEPLGFPDEQTFRSFVQTNAPPEYLDGNKDYYACAVEGTKVLLAILAIMMAGEGLSMAGQPAATVQEARQAAGKVLDIIRRVPSIDCFSEKGQRPSGCKGEVEVRDVVFAYPTAPDHVVCNGFSLRIPAGQTTALCGASGSGKSTLIQLLERFYDPLKGVITLDGVDIKMLNVRWLRGQLGLVGQEPVLFQGSVAENIAYGKDGTATQEEIEAAAKAANAHTFIMETLQDGYKTEVGQSGGKLSGGQKQRVAIARALIKKPAVLLLDEATSALDNQSEAVVQNALDEVTAKQQLTTIVIAHRLSTIRNAHNIAVINSGSVVEQGTYEDLIAKGGHFSLLEKKQQELMAQDIRSAAAHPAGPGDIPTGGDVFAVGELKVRVDVPGQEGKILPETGAAAKTDAVQAEVAMLPAVRRLFGMQRSHSLHLLLMFLLSAGACICPSVAFYQMVAVMTVLYGPEAQAMRDDAVRISTLLGILSGATICGFGLSGLFNGLAGAALTAKLRATGMAALMRQDMGYFDEEENSATNLTTFLSEKVAKVQTLTTEQLDLIAQLLGGVISSVVIIFWLCSWQLALIWLGVLPILAGTTSLELVFLSGGADSHAAKKGKEVTSERSVAEKSANHIVGEAVMGIRTVASHNLEQRFYDGFCQSSGKVAGYMKRDAVVHGIFQFIGNCSMVAIIGVTFWYAIWLANQGVIGFTQAIGPMFVITGAMVPLMKASALADIKSATATAAKLFTLFDRRSAIDSFNEEGQRPSGCKGEVEVRDVVFAYPTAPDHVVCNGFSLRIPAGQTTALCGASGSGKSTLIQLLERFYDPLKGVITLDGVDIKMLNVRWLRGQLGLVGQEPVLFQGSVAENIAYGKDGTATQEEIEAAAKAANAHTFIMETLQDGYKTEVGLKGSRLSGGQKQRVAIARALIKKPAVLLLDEATSALDNQSEAVVQNALDEVTAKQQLTTIVIAHRLSTIRNAHNIAVINSGSVVEQGTHQELLEQQGLYSSLVLSHS